MGTTPMYYSPKGDKCETSVEHGLPLWRVLLAATEPFSHMGGPFYGST